MEQDFLQQQDNKTEFLLTEPYANRIYAVNKSFTEFASNRITKGEVDKV